MRVESELLAEYRAHLKDRASLERRIQSEIDAASNDYRSWVLAEKEAKGVTPTTMIAEGDSWFHYIIGDDVIVNLSDAMGLPIHNLAWPGDEIRQMLTGAQRRKLEKELDRGPVDGEEYDFLLFSGGGNDLVGRDIFDLWLHNYEDGMSAEQVLNHDHLGPALTMIEVRYRQLIRIRNNVSPTTQIILHGYDFAYPNGERAACIIGPWLQPGLIARNVPEDLRKRVVELFLLELMTVLNRLDQVKGVHVVPTQGTLKSELDWDNELHPTDDGFAKIADKFREVIERHS